MQNSNIVPDEVTYNLMLNLTATNGDFFKMFDVLNAALCEGEFDGVFSENSTTGAIELDLRAHAHDGARRAFVNMALRDCRLDTLLDGERAIGIKCNEKDGHFVNAFNKDDAELVQLFEYDQELSFNDRGDYWQIWVLRCTSV